MIFSGRFRTRLPIAQKLHARGVAPKYAPRGRLEYACAAAFYRNSERTRHASTGIRKQGAKNKNKTITEDRPRLTGIVFLEIGYRNAEKTKIKFQEQRTQQPSKYNRVSNL